MNNCIIGRWNTWYMNGERMDLVSSAAVYVITDAVCCSGEQPPGCRFRRLPLLSLYLVFRV